jgi:glycosyltransferase involved in cell wall biosynthesis
MHDKLVTIVVPVKRSEPHLGTCLDSLVDQSYGETEIVVAGSALNDITQSLLDPYRDALTYIEQSGGTGPGHARNMAIIRATGDYIAFCDADDYFGRKHIEKEVETLKNGTAGLTYGDYTLIDAAGSEITTVTIPDWDFESWLRKWYIAFSTVMTTRDALLRASLFNEQLPVAEDFDLLWKLSAIVTFVRTPGAHTYRRIHPHSASRATLTLLSSRYKVYKSHGQPGAGALTFASGLITEPVLHFLYDHPSLYALSRRFVG